MTYNPSKNWRIMFNAAQQKAERGEAGIYQREFLEARIAEWSRPEVAVLSAGSTTNTVEAYRISSFTPYQQAIRSKGQPASELREWRANLITNYTFDKDSAFKGWSIGGAARWQDAVAIGFPVLATEDGTLYEDVHNPFMGDENIKADAWLAYSRPLFNNKVTWKIQLNVRNVFNEGLLVPVRANPVAIGDMQNFEIGAWRMGEKRTWELTSTFKF
jgi:outer membrane receptor protein involved in Fe transport